MVCEQESGYGYLCRDGCVVVVREFVTKRRDEREEVSERTMRTETIRNKKKKRVKR